MAVVSFQHVDVIFGPDPSEAKVLLDQGLDRDAIFSKTQNLVAVHDACLDVREGEICVLMGLSGSGKSSLLRCVNGLNKVSRGKVLVADGERMIDVAEAEWTTLHRLRTERISMVFQQFALMPWRTVRDNVALGLELDGVSRAERYKIVAEKLALVRLEEWAAKYPNQLSGGMQQRVGLARALATDAGILLMDEPFSALDPLIRDHLQDELLSLQQELKKTIIFVSHDLDEALKIGTQIAIMDAGRIVQQGNPEEIVENPANEYVAQFVANMNPLKVLRCSSLMRTMGDLSCVQGDITTRYLDEDGQYTCTVDPEGRIKSATYGGGQVTFVPFEEGMNLRKLPANVGVTADVDTPIKAAVEVNYALGLPMPVLDGEEKLVGVVGHREILGSILGRKKGRRSEP